MLFPHTLIGIIVKYSPLLMNIKGLFPTSYIMELWGFISIKGMLSLWSCTFLDDIVQEELLSWIQRLVFLHEGTILNTNM